MDNNKKISEYDKLVVDIRNNLTTRLSDLMSKLLNSAQDKLFDMSDDADSNEEQNRYFDLMNEIRVLKPAIATTFSSKIKEFLVPAKEFEDRQKKQKTELDEELSLVDQDVMDDIFMVKGIGERSSAKYREQLSHLEARLEHLGLKSSSVFTKDALKPTNFCQAFDDALADNFSKDNKKLLFKMFDADVANKLDALYDSINNRMIDAGILPQIKLHVRTPSPSASRPKPAQAPPAENSEDNPPQNQFSDTGVFNAGSYGGGGGGYGSAGGAAGDQTGGQMGGQPGIQQGASNIGGFAMTAAPGGNYRHSNFAQAQQMPHQGGGDGHGQQGNFSAPGGDNQSAVNAQTGGYGGASGNAANEAAGGTNPMHNQQDSNRSANNKGEFQHYTAGMPASHVGRVIGNYIGAPFTPESTDRSSASHSEFYPESTAQHFGHQEIIQALSNIQNLPQFIEPDEHRVDAEAIKKAVLAEIAKASGGVVTKRINQIAEKTIDFIELIFDAIIDDGDISDAIKTLLLRLQIPIIKASMSDQEFFIYDDHPARVLLDLIAEVGVGITDHKDDMYIHLEKIISMILGEHELGTQTFQAALDSLNKYIEEQDTVTRTKEEEEQKQLLRSHARATVLKALRATTTGKSLPEDVHPLILKRWPTLMFNHYLTNGKENNAWVNLVLTLRHIVESVQPVSSAEQLARVRNEKEELFEHTEKYLSMASSSKKDIRKVMNAYKTTIQNHIEDANFTEDEVYAAEQKISHNGPVEEAPIEEHVNRNEIPPNVMPGMWFQIYMGDDQIARRCKLSVIIVEDANMMFVNHKGELVAEKTFDQFNKEVAGNKTKMIMGHSAFDHAFKAVINRLN